MKTRLYFAGQGSQGKQTIDKLGAERRLYAFCDKNTILKEPPHLYKESFLDSSAFSVWTGKVKIDIQQYAVFLLKNKNLFTVYANLDVIGNAKETEKNQIFLESQGLSPLPTFHIRSEISELKKLMEKYHYIGIGGMVGSGRTERDYYLRNIFLLWNDYRKTSRTVRFHGWGMTDFTLLKKFPFYSVDSTSWLSMMRFGTIPILKNGKVCGSKNKFIGLKRGGKDGADAANSYIVHFYQNYIEKFGIELPEFEKV